MSVQPLLEERTAEEFAGIMLGHLTGASVSMMTSVGSRTGLFETMSRMRPATAAAIAAASDLNERYVREWLAAMTTAGIVTYEQRSGTFHLPPEHAAILTAASGADNLASFAELLASISTVEDELVEAFRKGGGVPYRSFRRFHEVMRKAGDPARDRAVDSLRFLWPSLVQRLESGAAVLEIGCGSGHAAIRLAERFPRSRFTGYDFSAEAIGVARKGAAEAGVSNLRFEIADVAQIDAEGTFDVAFSFDAIHDQADPEAVLANVHRALRPAGMFVMAEPRAHTELAANLENPLAPMLYAISCFHCMTVSLALGGRGLGTMWGEQMATSMLGDAGFTNIRTKTLEGDLINNYFICHRP
jgi:2-polyprenyl-3-methyl-5-hydroxy-6-metoxy-1,4-benzoquinol methylase